MNDLHALASFKALDEGRLQPVGKGGVVVVTQEARKAAADLLDEVSSLLGDTGIGQVADLIRDGKYDEHDATLAFARFERDILARSRSEVGCTIPAEHPLAKGLRTSQKALDEIKRQEQANIAGYLAMRDMPIGSVAADARHQSETGAALTREGREAVARESTMIVIERDNGKPTVWCDAEIADIVRALNSCGLKTVASCSGHGHRPGIISLADGRELVIARDYAEARKIDALFPININGEEK